MVRRMMVVRKMMIQQRKFTGKCCRPEARTTLCPSLHSRNAGQHVTRATGYRNLQEKCRSPEPRPPTLCEPARSKGMSRFHKSHFIQKFTGETPGPRTATHTLCELAQSKRMSRLHKSHFVQKFIRKMPGPRIRDPYFVRACAVETHVKISQATSDGNLQVKCCRPKPRRTLCASLRRRNACHKSHFARRFTGKKLGPATHTFCEPAKSKHMSRFHKSHSIRKFAGKMPQTRVSTLIKHRPLLLL